MYFKENMVLALESLRSNKMRAFLTMLGIIIGIASVIAIMSVGNSLSTNIKKNMQSMGINNFMVNVQEKSNQFGEPQGDDSGSGTIFEDKDLITNEMIEAFKYKFEDRMTEISLSESNGAGRVKDGRLYANVSVTGANPGYKSVNSIEMVSGRFLNDSDIAGRKSLAVVSDKLVKSVFKENAYPLGHEIKLYSAAGVKTYIVIGVYKYKESSMFGASSASDKNRVTNMYIPVTLAKQEKTIKNYTAFSVMSKANVDAKKFSNDAKDFFKKYYDKNPKWEVDVMSMSSQIESITSMFSTISIAIAVIAAISLLVGGIGVMNIMLVSVTERTREIGTRKALGAKNFHIRMQFITEAMIISLVGGLIGLILGLLLGMLGSMLMKVDPAFTLPPILLAVIFSMVIGIFFGYYPAGRAAQLDPIDALRYE